VAGESSLPSSIAARENLSQVTNPEVIRDMCLQVLATGDAADLVAAYCGGNRRTVGVLVARVLSASGGKANPAAVNATMSGLLEVEKAKRQ
jgi:Asp-tRNA(Asn)/Glu-tRNA(Gln) amidotransferase B subunit